MNRRSSAKASNPSADDGQPRKRMKSGNSHNIQAKNKIRNEKSSSTNQKGPTTKPSSKKKGAAAKTTPKRKRAATKTATKAKWAASKNKTRKVVAAAKTKGKGEDAKDVKQYDPKEIKGILKGRINFIPPSEKKTIRLDWASKSISTIDEKRVADKVVVKGDYGPLDDQQMTDIQNHIKSTEMTLPQAISLRAAYLQQKTMFQTENLRREAKSVCSQYKMGHTVLDLAKKADQPPMNVFRVILSAMAWSKTEIKKTLRNPTKFKERERNEFLAAESMDLVSMVNQNEIHKNSEKFEDLLSAWLEQTGIRFVRQKQLETEQKTKFGKAILTPDFLLLDRVYINGTQCHWIDCKAFYGANLRFTIKKTKQQMRRYIDHWGSGAIVYLQGFSEAIKIEDCVLLNAHGALDAESLSRLEEEICTATNTVSLTTFNDNEKEN